MATTSGVASTSGHQRTTSDSQHEDDNEEDVDGVLHKYFTKFSRNKRLFYTNAYICL